MRKQALLALGMACLSLSAMEPAWSADHKDSPAVEADPATDLNDIFAFRNGDNLVVAMTVQSTRLAAGATDLFNPRARYQLFVDNSDDGTLAADATVTITFSGSAPQRFSVAGLTATPMTGPVSSFSETLVTENGGIKVFAGMRDDPFFFDVAGFRAFVSGPYTPAAGLRQSGTPMDGFEGLNVAAIVIELPIVAVTGLSDPNSGSIRTWAATSVLQ